MPQQATSTRFLPYQQRWLSDASPRKLMVKSRQIGMTWASAYGCLRRLAVGTDRHIWVSSRDALQARLFIEDAVAFARIINAAAGLKQQCLLPAGGSGGGSMSLELASGARLHSLSSSADAQAGKRGSRLLDEFALHPDPRQLYSIALPGLTWGGQLEIVSTHRGQHNFFNQLIEEARHGGNPKGFSVHQVRLEDALCEGLLDKLKAKWPQDDERQHWDEATYFDQTRLSCPDQATFLQEYQCVPMEDAASFLGHEALSACVLSEVDTLSLQARALTDPSRRLSLGVDLARENDLSVFCLLETTHDTHTLCELKCLHKTPFNEQEAILASYLALPGLARVVIDQSGLGRQFAERALSRYGRNRVEGLTITGPVQADLAYALKRCVEDRRVRLPEEPQLLADLRSVRMTTGARGQLSFLSPRQNGSHADRFWALALALRAATHGARPFVFTSVSGNSGGHSQRRRSRRG
jgi:phage FluMu gp28-like protein